MAFEKREYTDEEIQQLADAGLPLGNIPDDAHFDWRTGVILED